MIFPVDPADCTWEDPLKSYISGNDKKKLSSMSAEQCKKSCEREDDFFCNSFDYVSASKQCYLQEVNRMSHVLTASTSYVYYERDCDGQWQNQ